VLSVCDINLTDGLITKEMCVLLHSGAGWHLHLHFFGIILRVFKFCWPNWCTKFAPGHFHIHFYCCYYYYCRRRHHHTTITIITLGEKWQGVKLSLLDRGVTSCSNPTEWMSFYDVCVSVIIHRTYIPKPQRGFCTLWSAIHRSRSLLTLLLQLAQTIKWLANYGKFGELPRSAFEY
jgi:hypothetical protein